MKNIESIKNILKQTGLYQKFEHWIGRSRIGLYLFVNFIRLQASKKKLGVKIRRQDNDTIKIVVNSGDNYIWLSPRHFVYLQDIVLNFDYYFNAVIPESQGDLKIVDYSELREHVLKPSGVHFYFNSLAEPLETSNIYLDYGRLREGDVVLDLGAYCGMSVWAFAQAVGETGRVYAFEPDPENFATLSRNISSHNLKNAIPINKGVWSSSTKMLFQSEGNMGSGIVSILGRNTNVHEISTISLDDFCTEYHITRIDYIKMDIEGAELEVLRTGMDFIEKYKPRLIIEPHIVGTKLATEDICQILSNYGYKTQVIPQGDLALPLIYAHPATEEL